MIPRSIALLTLAGLLLASPASAGDETTMASLDLRSLEDLAARAYRLIDDCRDGTLECWHEDSRLALARAYLVRVTHQRVVLGHADQQGAANARYLAPHVAQTWNAALPGDDGTVPEDWLFDLELIAMVADREEDEFDGGAPAYEAADAAAPDEAIIDIDMELGWKPAHTRGAISGFGLFGVRPGQRQPGTQLTGGPELSPEGALRGHVVVGSRGVVLGGVEYRYVHLRSPSEIERLTAVSPIDQTATGRSALLATHTMRVEVGGGVRVGPLDRHEAVLWGALGGSSGGFTTATNLHLWDDYDYLASPGFAGFGPRVGVTTTHLLGREAKWAVVWSVAATAEQRWTNQRYNDPQLPYEFPRAGEEALFPAGLSRDDTAADRIQVDADLALRFRPTGGLAVTLGPAFRMTTDIASEEASVAWFGTRVPVAETAWYVMPRLGVTMLLR